MIINTESDEGKALVALARFGMRVLHMRENSQTAFSLGVARAAQAEKLLDQFLDPTDLAKLPEVI